MLFATLPLQACDIPDEYGMIRLDSASEESEALKHFRFRYVPPLGYFPSPFTLWDGYDERTLNYPYYRPTAKTERQQTYMLEWAEKSEDYYFVYLDDTYEMFFSEGTKTSLTGGHWIPCAQYCSFFDSYDEKYVDGKRLCVLQWDEAFHLLTCYKSSSLSGIPLHRDGSTLVFAAKRKEIKVLENISSNTVVSHSLYLYSRVGLCFDNEECKPVETKVRMEDDAAEGLHFHFNEYLPFTSDDMFDAKGKMIVADKLRFEELNSVGLYDFLMIGHRQQLLEIDGKECFRIRTGSVKNDGTITSLLDDVLKEGIYDVFGETKSFIRSLVVKEEQFDKYIFSYLDFNRLKSFIAERAALD